MFWGRPLVDDCEERTLSVSLLVSVTNGANKRLLNFLIFHIRTLYGHRNVITY